MFFKNNMKIFNNTVNHKLTRQKYQPSFRSVTREYHYEGLGQMGNYTWMFRDDIKWLELAKLEIDLFKNEKKVNIIQFASSDGSESYTKIISLLESKNMNEVKKFFPIEAYDINPEIVNAAKSGYINIDEMDLSLIKENIKNINDYFQASDETFKIEGDTRKFPKRTYIAKEQLQKNVKFNIGDMFNIIQQISQNFSSIILCRNCLGYFPEEKARDFITDIAKKIKENSLFVIGYLEDNKKIGTILEENNFKKIMKNVYQKIPK